MRRFLTGAISSIAALLLLSGTAMAHVSVKPAEVLTATFQTFTVSVPNERNVAVTGIILKIPDGVNFVTPSVKTGWTVNTTKEGEGEAATVKSIVWSGGIIDAGLRDDFTFSAQSPAEAGELHWEAVQTYADDLVVTWNQDPSAEESDTTGPYSITKVVSETAATTASNEAKSSADSAKSTAQWALYISIAAAAVSLLAIFFASRKK